LQKQMLSALQRALLATIIVDRTSVSSPMQQITRARQS
jgi:hypothetical protein